MTVSSKWMTWIDPRQWLRAILILKDDARAIALGSAIGVFVAFTPTVGIQVLIVLIIALLSRPFFRFNRLAAILAVNISNPFTVVPIYWFNYRLGSLMYRQTVSRTEFASLFKYSGVTDWWRSFQAVFMQVGTPLLLGSLIVATVLGLATYPLMYRLLTRRKRMTCPQSLAAKPSASGSRHCERIAS